MTAEKPLVTIATSCYNHEKYLDEYFEGLLAQTYTNVELIFFDDGSTDESWKKVQSYESRLKNKFSKVILEHHSNIGFLPEVDLALSRATGEFFCLIGSDDSYLPTMIEEVSSYLVAHPEKGMVHGDTDYVYTDKIEQRHWKTIDKKIPEDFVFEDLLKDNFVMMCAAAFRTELLRRHCSFKEYIRRGYLMEDYPLLLDLAKHTQFGYIDKSLARYRVLPESMSHSKDPKKAFGFWESGYRIRLDYIKKYGAADGHRIRADRSYFGALYYVGYEKNVKEATLKGYQWLRKNYPEEFGTYWHQARVFSTGNPWLWEFIRKIEKRKIIYKTKKFLGIAK